jgi:hypothetical protein
MTPSSHGADAPSATGAKHSGLLWAIGGLGVLGVFLWCLLVIPGTPDAFPIGDAAVIELYTLQASRGWWEYGAYSRWGWHHPGPMMFYALAVFYTAAHANFLAIIAGAVAINVAALTATLWAVARHGSATLAVAVTASLALYLWRLPLLGSAWNPHLVLLPLAALIVSASIAAAGRVSLLPLTIVMATFVTQTHIALLSSAAAATACALVAGLTAGLTGSFTTRAAMVTAENAPARASGRDRWFWLGVSMLIAFVLWLPPIVEQVTHDDGNFSKIARFFMTPNPGDPGVPFMPALRAWASALLASFRPGLSIPGGGALASEASTPVVVLAVSSIVLLIVAGWRTSRGAVDAWFCRICALLSIVALPAIMRAQGGLGDYMVAWITMIGVMNAAALAAWLFTWLFTVIARRGANVRAGWIVPVVTCTCLIAVIAHGAIGLERNRAGSNAPRPPEAVRMPGESAYGALRAFLAKARIRKPLIRVAGTWDNAATIVLKLDKRGQPVAVDDDALWLIGPKFKRDGTEDADMTLAAKWERENVTRRDGDCMLIERHGLSLHVLLPSLRTPITLTCE